MEVGQKKSAKMASMTSARTMKRADNRDRAAPEAAPDELEVTFVFLLPGDQAVILSDGLLQQYLVFHRPCVFRSLR